MIFVFLHFNRLDRYTLPCLNDHPSWDDYSFLLVRLSLAPASVAYPTLPQLGHGLAPPAPLPVVNMLSFTPATSSLSVSTSHEILQSLLLPQPSLSMRSKMLFQCSHSSFICCRRFRCRFRCLPRHLSQCRVRMSRKWCTFQAASFPAHSRRRSRPLSL